MAEYSANQVTITNGFKAVVINSGESPENVRQGDFLFVTGSDPVAINRTYINASNKHVIELTKNWGQGNKNNQPAIVLPSTAEYKAVADALKNANLLVNDNFVAMQDWQTKTGTVSFVNIDGTTTTVKTLKQIESEASTATNAAMEAVETRAQAAYREAVEAASSGKNTVKYDAQGNPNVMVWINKFNSEDVNQAILERHGVDLQLGTGVFPAFIKNGVQMRGFWYAKYIASAGASGGCSVVAGVQPRTSVNYDTAKALCTAKGAGWHLSANIEWLAVAYLSLAFGDQPRGDTNYGRAHDAKHEVATRASSDHAPGDTGHSSSSYTGTGPATWSHDGTQFGVFDMVGNVWEWQDQLKLQEGQIFAPLDNNPDMPEGSWPAHECYFDSSGATSGSVILNSLITNRTGDLGDNGSGNGSNSNTWRTMSKDPSYVENLLMRQMGIEPPTGAILNGSIYSRNFGERVPFRGGVWSSTSGAGLGALNFYYGRTAAGSRIGFRPALFES